MTFIKIIFKKFSIKLFSRILKFINDKFLRFFDFFRINFLRYFEYLINFMINVLEEILIIMFVILLKFLNFSNIIILNFKKIFVLILIKFQNKLIFKVFFKKWLFSSKTFFTIVLNERFSNAKKFWTNFFCLKNIWYFENFIIDNIAIDLFIENTYKFVCLNVLRTILIFFLNELFSWLHLLSLKYNELFLLFNNNWYLLN